jgi:potassium channel subfamily K, other eukaryote
LLAGAAGPLRNQSGPDVIFSQAFYYAIFSAGLYFMCASLLLMTAIGAYFGHCDKEFKLTMSQRTLMLQTISFLVYLLVGSVIYSHIEGWHFLDAVYWADYTLLTVGIGDIAPSTNLGRGLLFPYAIGGIIILGLVIGSIRSLVLERGKVKLGARMLEKERERLIRKVRRKKAALLIPVMGKKSNESEYPELGGCTERERRQREFNLMRKVQENAAARERWASLAVSGTTWFFLWFAGAAVFRVCTVPLSIKLAHSWYQQMLISNQATEADTQQWGYYQGLYFSYTSLLTIGYGDIFPESNAGKPFFVFWSLLAIPSLTILISNMGDTIVKGFRDFTLWVGIVTVLPSEHGVRASMKLTIMKVCFLSPIKQWNPTSSHLIPSLRYHRN